MDEDEKLHAQLFGDLDDSDDDDDAAPPAAPAETDDRIAEIVAANADAAAAAPKRKKKGDAAEPKKRLKKSADEMAAMGQRLENGEKIGSILADRGGLDGEGGGTYLVDDDGNEVAMAAPEDDPDDDSVDGDEAIEEGGKNDLEMIISGKRKGKKKEMTLDESNRVVDAMLARMEEAARLDDEALKAEAPATQKAALMTEVVEFVRKRCAAAAAAAQFSRRAILPTRAILPARRAILLSASPGRSLRNLHECMLDRGVLERLRKWIEPSPGALVNLHVRSGVLNALNMFEVDDVLQSALRTSQVGRYVKLLSVHPKETPQNRRLATALVEKWLRRIFGNSAEFRSSDVPMYRPKQTPKDLHAMRDAGAAAGAPSKKDDEANANLQFSRQGLDKGIIPRPIGMDFSAQPESTAKAAASSKYAKESVKGRLSERFTNNQRGKTKTTQAATLSIEGRGVDRV